MSVETEKATQEGKSAELAARCHEIQTGLTLVEVPEFDTLTATGMAVRLALHIRGLPAINFDVLRLVASHYLGIPPVVVKRIVEILGEVEFVKIAKEGKRIKTILPTVPYYQDLYNTLGDYAVTQGLNESEQLSIEILKRLAKSPEKLESLKSQLGADKKLINRAIEIGQEGAYLRQYRYRGRDVLLSPVYFSENADIFADIVAAKGSKQVQKVLNAVKSAQGIPLEIIRKKKKISNVDFSDEEISLLIRLAQDGVVKPPCIETTYAGENYFIFTPTPAGAALAPTKRDIYEKAMAIVAAVRQGQFLPKRYAIRSPGAVLYTLKSNLRLGKATTEATQQYRKLVHLRVAQLIDVGGGYSELRIIDTPENLEALKIAYSLVESGSAEGVEVDQDAREALQRDQAYVESLIASAKLQKRKKVQLSDQQQLELENLFL
ncbi:MAG: hypothetical protein ABFC86_08150 [Rectinema sp.]|nr:MAG: hypothetical protein A4E59_00229 [Syntrophorhabdus sp. PtaB.Bin027]